MSLKQRVTALERWAAPADDWWTTPRPGTELTEEERRVALRDMFGDQLGRALYVTETGEFALREGADPSWAQIAESHNAKVKSLEECGDKAEAEAWRNWGRELQALADQQGQDH